MRRLRMFAVLLAAFPFLTTTVHAQTAAPEANPPASLATSFAQLVFDFCVPAVSQSAGPIASLGTASLAIKGPFPLSQIGQWSESLQSRLNAKPDSPIYQAVPAAAAVGRFHLAYVMADGSACIVLAQDIPDVALETLTRIRSNPEYKLEGENAAAQVYTHAKTGNERSFRVVTPREPRNKGVENVLIAFDENVRPRVADADREAWSKAIFQTCLQSARQKSVVSVASFGEFMTEEPAKNGGMSIVAPKRYPGSMLFPEAKPFGCRLMLVAGAEDGAKVVASWRATLENVSAKPARSTQPHDLSYLVEPESKGESRVRITIAELLSGFYSLVILSDGR